MDKSEGIWVIMLLKDFLVSTLFTFSILKIVLNLFLKILFFAEFKQSLVLAGWFARGMPVDLLYWLKVVDYPLVINLLWL